MTWNKIKECYPITSKDFLTAARQGMLKDLTVLEKYIKIHQDNPQALDVVDAEGNTALMWAIRNGNASAIRLLLDANCSIHKPALELALQIQHTEIRNMILYHRGKSTVKHLSFFEQDKSDLLAQSIPPTLSIAEEPQNIVVLDIDGVLSNFATGTNVHTDLLFEEHKDFIASKWGIPTTDLSEIDFLSKNNIDAHVIALILRFSKEAVENLRFLCDQTKAKIVISSDWRMFDSKVSLKEESLKRLKLLFKLWDLDTYIIDETPFMEGCLERKESPRQLEILSWLQSTKIPVKNYVVIDDANYGTPLMKTPLRDTFKEHFICTSEGEDLPPLPKYIEDEPRLPAILTKSHVEKALSILKPTVQAEEQPSLQISF